MVAIENSWQKLAFCIESELGHVPEKILCVTDDIVAPLYLKQVEDALAKPLNVYKVVPGENGKSLNELGKLLKFMQGIGLDRGSLVLALGGGVVGDLAGFAACIYMRGVKYINLPTTLLACVDSGIGGKCGINLNGAKNLVGAFYQPALTYINISALKTLSVRDYTSGIAEIIKCGVIKDRALLEYMQANHEGILNMQEDALMHIIVCATNIKLQLVAQDEKDVGVRQLLNFGHTFGHGIESFLDYALPHGHCVALGMVCAMDYSVRHFGLPAGDASFVKGLIKGFGLPVQYDGLDADEIYNLMKQDKKVQNGDIKLILVSEIGHAQVVGGHCHDEIKKSINVIVRGN